MISLVRQDTHTKIIIRGFILHIEILENSENEKADFDIWDI